MTGTRNKGTDLVLGTTLPPLPRQQVVLTPAEQASHISLFGKTGTGKSTLLKAVYLQAVNRGQGIALLEPHHDLSFGILSYLVKSGFYRDPASFERLIYLDWGRAFVPFNILRSSTDPTTTALLVLDAYLRVFPELRSAPAFQTLFLSAVTTLCCNNLPITCLYELLSDSAFRQRCLQRVSDPLVHLTFQNAQTRSGDLQPQLTGAALRRAFLTTFHPIARLTLGQPENWLDQRRLMDQGICVIHNLGNIADPETRSLIAALLMVQLEHAALSRTDLAPEARRPYAVLVDEWLAVCAQEETIGNLLAQVRKFNVRLWLAAQSTSQIGSSRLAGALENCTVQLVFGLGYESAAQLAKHLGRLDPYLLPANRGGQYATSVEELQNLPAQVAYLKRLHQPAVKMQTLTVPAAAADPQEVERVLATYRQRYQRSQREAEHAVAHVAQVAHGRHVAPQPQGDATQPEHTVQPQQGDDHPAIMRRARPRE